MWKLRELVEYSNDNLTEVDGRWIPAKPVVVFSFRTMWSRLLSSYLVLVGKADVFIWEDDQ